MMNKRLHHTIKMVSTISTSILLAACAFTARSHHVDGPPPPTEKVDISQIPNAIPKAEPKSIYGNPPSYEVFGKRYFVLPDSNGYSKKGIASWYGTKFQHKRTSSGEPYNMYAMTAAHKTLPIPCYVKVTNLNNNRQVIVKVNDRGPFHENRIIDLSYAAAKKLGILKHGTGLVEVDAINPLIDNQQQPGPSITPSYKPRIFLQVGAFGQRKNAERLARRIRALTQQHVRLDEAQMQNRQLYRVQIGPLMGIQFADSIHDKLKNVGLGDAIAVIQ